MRPCTYDRKAWKTAAQKTTAVGSELPGSFLHSFDASCHYEYANNRRIDQVEFYRRRNGFPVTIFDSIRRLRRQASLASIPQIRSLRLNRTICRIN